MRRMRMALVALVLRRPLFVGTVATLAVVGIGLAGATPWLEWRKAAPTPEEAAFTLQRAFAEEAPAVTSRPVADFVLTDLTGRRVRLREQAGKVVLVNFITTRCTTACVQVTRELQGLQKALGDRMGREVVFLSVGLDHKRDTPAALRRFARRHAVDFRGWAFLSGDRQDLEEARRAFGALAMQVPTFRGPDHYDIEHTTATYLVNREGLLRKKIQPGTLILVGLREIEAVLASNT